MSFINTEYFKNLLLKERERVLKNIEEINKDLALIAAEDAIDDIEDLAQLEFENEREKAALKALNDELKEINEAIRRINEGRYGIDEKTGKPIPLLKLLKNPLLKHA